VGIKRAKFIKELNRFNKVGLDSSLLIYHLEDMEPYSDLTEVVFAAIGAGTHTAVLSTISVTELLVKPFADGQPDQVAVFEHFVQLLPNTIWISPHYEIAKQAARLRGQYRLRTPDALLVATALVEKADAFLTNDHQLRKLKAEGIVIVVLDDYVE
jgi:predicted nucleic acid-binding protein